MKFYLQYRFCIECVYLFFSVSLFIVWSSILIRARFLDSKPLCVYSVFLINFKVQSLCNLLYWSIVLLLSCSVALFKLFILVARELFNKHIGAATWKHLVPLVEQKNCCRIFWYFFSNVSNELWAPDKNYPVISGNFYIFVSDVAFLLYYKLNESSYAKPGKVYGTFGRLHKIHAQTEYMEKEDTLPSTVDQNLKPVRPQ